MDDDGYSDSNDDHDEYENYKEHQERYESLKEEWKEDADYWDNEQRPDHLQNMRDSNQV
jgi:hypothetical protein